VVKLLPVLAAETGGDGSSTSATFFGGGGGSTTWRFAGCPQATSAADPANATTTTVPLT
jgi:hypothetical protein